MQVDKTQHTYPNISVEEQIAIVFSFIPLQSCVVLFALSTSKCNCLPLSFQLLKAVFILRAIFSGEVKAPNKQPS